MKKFKAHCSSLGTVMRLTSLTDNQLQKIAEYTVKEKLTEKQREEYNNLVYRRDNPELMEGAKTLLRNWYAYKIGLDKGKEYIKEAQKGIVMEDHSIELLDNIIFGSQGLIKNTSYNSNEYIQGTADVIGDDFVLDAKSPWDSKTFFQKAIDKVDIDYIWQLKGYCLLENKEKAILGYAMVNTPTHACLMASYQGKSYDTLEFQSTYEHIEESSRVIAYQIPILESDEKEIEVSILKCREYLDWFQALVESKIGNVNNL